MDTSLKIVLVSREYVQSRFTVVKQLICTYQGDTTVLLEDSEADGDEEPHVVEESDVVKTKERESEDDAGDVPDLVPQVMGKGKRRKTWNKKVASIERQLEFMQLPSTEFSEVGDGTWREYDPEIIEEHPATPWIRQSAGVFCDCSLVTLADMFLSLSPLVRNDVSQKSHHSCWSCE